jgi:hypothetical protein
VLDWEEWPDQDERREAAELEAIEAMPAMSYQDFRTGLDFQDVKSAMWTEGPPPWRMRRRSDVLGYWKQLKGELYGAYIERVDKARQKLVEDLLKQNTPF